MAVRPWVRPVLAEIGAGVPPDHPYVRWFWVAAIGRGAVSELLRLIAAARVGRRIRQPVYLPVLLMEGLARRLPDTLEVFCPVPYLGPAAEGRLTPALRAWHRQVTAGLHVASASGATG